MSNYRRWYQPGGTYFFTVVTSGRIPIFSDAQARTILGDVTRSVKAELPFEPVAIVLLPDHLHAVWQLPPGDHDFSTRWKLIKSQFTSGWRKLGGREAKRTPFQITRGSRGIWQRRFWEHLIRDENDLEAHIDYIHYNPVKHGYVIRPWDWEPSTFRRYVALGHYDRDWGRSEPDHIQHMNLE